MRMKRRLKEGEDEKEKEEEKKMEEKVSEEEKDALMVIARMTLTIMTPLGG